MRLFIMMYGFYMFYHISMAAIPYTVFLIGITLGSFDKNVMLVMTTYTGLVIVISFSFLYHDNNITAQYYFRYVDIIIKTYFVILILCHPQYIGYLYVYMGSLAMIDAYEKTHPVKKGVDE